MLEGLEEKNQGEAAPKLTKELLARAAELLSNQIQVCMAEALHRMACQHGGIYQSDLAVISESGWLPWLFMEACISGGSTGLAILLKGDHHANEHIHAWVPLEYFWCLSPGRTMCESTRRCTNTVQD